MRKLDEKKYPVMVRLTEQNMQYVMSVQNERNDKLRELGFVGEASIQQTIVSIIDFYRKYHRGQISSKKF